MDYMELILNPIYIDTKDTKDTKKRKKEKQIQNDVGYTNTIMEKETSNVSDEELVKMIVKTNNTELFAEIIKRYQTKVYHLGLSFFKKQDDAMDFSQEVFIKLFKKLETFKHLSKFSVWLYKIAFNMAINEKKSKQTKTYDIIDENYEIQDLKSYGNPFANLQKSEIKEIILAELKTLPDEYKMSLLLFYYENMSYKQISKILNKKVNTIKSYLLRGKKLLRKSLEKKYKNVENLI